MKQEITIQSGKNRLKGYLELPKGDLTSKIPIAILLHGLCDHKDCEPQVSLAADLVRRNMAVLRMDFNGHGESSGDQVDMTVPNELEDAEIMLEYVHSLSFISKVIVIGHSQGGIVASLLAGKHPDLIDGLILLAPAVVIEVCAQSGDFGFIHYDPENIPDKIMIDGWDFWIGRKYLETAKDLKIYENSKAYKGKVCIVQGEEDGLVPLKYAMQYERIYKDCQLSIIPECNHVFEGQLGKLIEIVDEFIYYKVLR